MQTPKQASSLMGGGGGDGSSAGAVSLFAPAGTAPYRCERMKAAITYCVWRILMQGMFECWQPVSGAGRPSATLFTCEILLGAVISVF